MTIDLLVASLADAKAESEEAFAQLAGAFGELSAALRVQGEPGFREPESVRDFERQASGALLDSDLAALAGVLASLDSHPVVPPLMRALTAGRAAILPGSSPEAPIEAADLALGTILAGDAVFELLCGPARDLGVSLDANQRPDAESLDAVLSCDPESDLERARLAAVELLDALACSRESGSALLFWPATG